MHLKKIFLTLFFCLFLLTSCLNLGNSTPTVDESTPTNPNIPTNEQGTENNDNNEDEVVNTGFKFGDKVTVVNSTNINVTEQIKKLTTKVKGKKNDIYQSSYQQGLLDLFNINNKVEIVIDINEEQLKYLDINHEKNNQESYQLCNVDITLNNIKYHYENVGIRQKGNTSRGSIITDDKINLRHYKLSFCETFDDEFRTDKQTFSKEQLEYMKARTFYGLEKLDLRWNRNRDHSHIREYYAYEMYRQNGILSARSNIMNVKFKINNKTENLGLYLGIEPIDGDFIKRNMDKIYEGGDLYKLGWTNQGATFDSTESSLFGIETQKKHKDGFKQEMYPYDLKTNKSTSSHQSIKSFITMVKGTNNTKSYDTFNQITHYKSFIKYLAISYLLGDPDDLRGNYNNTYIYFVPEINKAIFIPNDHDRTFGSTGGTGNPTGHHGASNKPYDSLTGYGGENMSPLFTKTILKSGNQKIKEDYYNEIQNILSNSTFTYESYLKVYEIVKKTYYNNISIGKNVNDSAIKFKIEDEDKNLDSDWNLNVEVYINTKRQSAIEE